MTLSLDECKKKMEEAEQEHVFKFWDNLDDGQKKNLLAQVESIDMASLQFVRDLIGEKSAVSEGVNMEPAAVITLSKDDEGEASSFGEELIADGKVGVILVAGGQGTRLGFDGPKGAFPVGPISNESLFGVHSKKILAMEKKYKTEIPFYIMTSCMNDKQTKDFFEDNSYFGLAPERVMFFVQGMWPGLNTEGKLVLDNPDHIFMSPDGHGGLLAALQTNGMLEDMSKRGVESLFFFQVDNPLVEIADPAFIGVHAKNKADISIKVCAKRDPGEGLGVVVDRNGSKAIVEYTELTDEQKNATLPDGKLKFLFGSVAIHVFSLGFLQKEAEVQMPVHLAHKKIPYCDDDGEVIKPEKPNGFKFEKFIFDVVPNASKVVNLEFLREKEFSPVKNASGPDSPETSSRDMVRKYAGWLEECGVVVPRDKDGEPVYKIEIDPGFALGSSDLVQKIEEGLEITADLLLN